MQSPLAAFLQNVAAAQERGQLDEPAARSLRQGGRRLLSGTRLLRAELRRLQGAHAREPRVSRALARSRGSRSAGDTGNLGIWLDRSWTPVVSRSRRQIPIGRTSVPTPPKKSHVPRPGARFVRTVLAGLMLLATVVFLPIILAYTGYAYWVFRGKVDPAEGYH